MTLLGQFSGVDGFLGHRGSIMLDVVVAAMLAIVPVLAWSIWLVRRGRFALHKRVQLVLAAVLLVAIAAFEVDLRLFTDWEQRAEPSPYFTPDTWCPVWYSLIVHLLFAVPTVFLWIGVVAAALRRFPKPPAPGAHSPTHRRWARLAAFFMLMTAVTGWVFYWMAFVAV